jgi:hypothetical protein
MRPVFNFFHYLIILPRTYFRIREINKVLSALKEEVSENIEWREVIASKGFDLRLTQYVQVHSLLDYSLCGLAGRKISKKELKACVYFCASLPLYDDFFDKNNLTAEEIKLLMKAPEDFKPKSSVEGLFIHLLKEVYKNLPDTVLFAKYFEGLYYGQEESKKLLDPTLDFEHVKKIAFEKGGHSALLFRSILKHPFLKGEEEALYQLGVVGQLLDDIFDLWDDLEEGVNTIVTKYNVDFTPVYNSYLSEVESLRSSVLELKYSRRCKNKFIRELMLMVNGGTLCGQHYMRLQKENKGIFDIQKIGRESLVCDMENKLNWIKMIKISISNA